MQAGALRPYEHALRGTGSVEIVLPDGTALPLDVRRWMADADEHDRSVIGRCTEPTLDVGCGPGRLVRALYAHGIAALGVDIARAAVAMSNELGGPALLRDVFDDLPAEGRWATILLLDGNVGIGGDAPRLLARARDLLAADGRVIAEVSPWAGAHSRLDVRFRQDGVLTGPVFPWAVLDRPALVAAAAAAGLDVHGGWRAGTREFLLLGEPLAAP